MQGVPVPSQGAGVQVSRSNGGNMYTRRQVHQSVQFEKQTLHKSPTGSFIKQYPQNTSLNVNSEEATQRCWPSRQSNKEKAISQTVQKKEKILDRDLLTLECTCHLAQLCTRASHSFYSGYSQSALFCEGSSTQCCTRSSVSWQFLAWNSLHFQTDEFQKKGLCFWPF